MKFKKLKGEVAHMKMDPLLNRGSILVAFFAPQTQTSLTLMWTHKVLWNLLWSQILSMLCKKYVSFHRWLHQANVNQGARLKSCLAGPGNFLLSLQGAFLYGHGLPLNMLTKLLPLSLWELMRSQPRKTVSFIKTGTWKLNQFLKFVSLVINSDRPMGLNFFFYCINAEQTLIKTKHSCELLSLSFQETASW